MVAEMEVGELVGTPRDRNEWIEAVDADRNSGDPTPPPPAAAAAVTADADAADA